jgi:tripartite-type tricarboxylate transporter receptor subunit TctC
LPDVATMSEAGLRGVAAESWFGLVVSSTTPAPIVARLQSALAAAQRDPAYLEGLTKQKVSVGDAGPDSFAKRIREDGEKWRSVIRAAGIKF